MVAAVGVKEYLSIGVRYRSQLVELRDVPRGITQTLKPDRSQADKLRAFSEIILDSTQPAPLSAAALASPSAAVPENASVPAERLFEAMVLRALVQYTRGTDASLYEYEFDAALHMMVHLSSSSPPK